MDSMGDASEVLWLKHYPGNAKSSEEAFKTNYELLISLSDYVVLLG